MNFLDNDITIVKGKNEVTIADMHDSTVSVVHGCIMYNFAVSDINWLCFIQ